MTDDLYWVGASDRRLALFENVYPISRGVSYNSYLLLDEKTVLLDTADSSVSGIFFENVEHVLGVDARDSGDPVKNGSKLLLRAGSKPACIFGNIHNKTKPFWIFCNVFRY